MTTFALLLFRARCFIHAPMLSTASKSRRMPIWLCKTCMSDGRRRVHDRNLKLFATTRAISSSSAVTPTSDETTKKSKKFESTPISKLSEDVAKLELEALDGEINKHDDLYYLQDNPILSDAAYDKLVKRAEGIEGKFPALKGIVGKLSRGTVGSGSKSATLDDFFHTKPMLSLENAFNRDDVFAFFSRIQKVGLTSDKTTDANITYVVEPKIDGLSVALHYLDGELVAAGTRGNGLVGEDVLVNLRSIGGVPICLPRSSPLGSGHVEVRGEVYISKKNFAFLNKGRAEPFSTARNAAAGSLRRASAAEEERAEGSTERLRYLDFTAYHTLFPSKFPSGSGEAVSFSERPAVLSQSQGLQVLRGSGFNVTDLWRAFLSEEEVYAYCKQLESVRDEVPFDVDGAVVKVDSLEFQRIVGDKNRFPKWAVAYKFAEVEAVTELLAITVQVGRTGLLTPVAELRPVSLGGVTIERASLHNANEVNRLGLRVGAAVRVKRAGDVIPKVVGLAEDAVEAGTAGSVYSVPTQCPVCGSAVVAEESGVLHRCSGGLACSAQLTEGILHFCSRDAFDIDHLGPARVEELHEMGLLRSPADIFRLRERDISGISQSVSGGDTDAGSLRDAKGWGDRSVNNLLQSIDSRKRIEFHKFLYALGVRHVGIETAKDIAMKFGSFGEFWTYVLAEGDKYVGLQERISSCSEDKSSEKLLLKEQGEVGMRLMQIKGLGLKAAKSLYSFARSAEAAAMVADLLLHVEVLDDRRRESADADAAAGKLLVGQTVVFTGKMKVITRAKAMALVRDLGGDTANIMNKSTTILVVGSDTSSEDAESTKMKKAKKDNINIWTEERFIDFCKTN